MQMNLKSIWIYLSKLIGLYSTYHLIGHTRCLLNLIAQLKKAFNEMGGRLAEAQFLLNFGHLECFHQGINAWVNALNLTSWTSRRRTWGTPPTPTSSSIILLKSMTRFWTFTLKTSKSFQELVNKKDLGYILEVTTSWMAIVLPLMILFWWAILQQETFVLLEHTVQKS